MYKEILMIVNPKAGKAKSQKYVPKIITTLEKQDNIVDVKYTTLENNATKIIKNYKNNFDVIIVFGGDGTLNEVVQGLYDIKKRVYIGFIPFGTTNDFAKSLVVSHKNLELSDSAKNYYSKKVDIGLISDNVFNYVVSFGIFSKTSYATSRFLKNKFGRLAYLVNGAKEIFFHKTYKIKIESEEKKLEDEFIYGSVSNSQYIGGFNLFKNEKIELNDGKFEAIFVKKPKNIFSTFRLIFKVLSGNLNDKNICYFKTSKIKINSYEEIEISIDGEYGGKRREIEACNIRENIEYILPKNIKKVTKNKN